MKTEKKRLLKTAAVVLWLAAAAAASYCSMQFFTRSVFGNDWRWQLCFAALALCLLISVAVKKPAVCLAVSAAAAVGMQFLSPYYIPFFFAVSLQAALWEAARDGTKTGRAVFALSLLLVPASVPLRLRLAEYLRFNLPADSWDRPFSTAYPCLIGLFALLALWGVLLAKSLRKRPGQKKSAKKGGRGSRTAPRKDLSPAVYAVSALHAALCCLTSVLHFSEEYVKLLLFANALFVFYLLYRKDPLLFGTLQTVLRRHETSLIHSDYH